MMEQVRNEIYKPGTVVVAKDHLEWGEGRVLGAFDDVYAVQFAMHNDALPGVCTYGIQMIEKGFGAEIQGSRLTVVKGAKAEAPEWAVLVTFDGESVLAEFATGYDDQEAEELVSVEAPTDAGTNIPGVLMDVAIRMLYGGYWVKAEDISIVRRGDSDRERVYGCGDMPCAGGVQWDTVCQDHRDPL